MIDAYIELKMEEMDRYSNDPASDRVRDVLFVVRHVILRDGEKAASGRPFLLGEDLAARRPFRPLSYTGCGQKPETPGTCGAGR